MENVHPIPESLLERYGVGKWAWLSTTLVPYGGFLAGTLEAGQRDMVQPATGHFGAAAVAVAIAMGASTVFAAGNVLNAWSEICAKGETGGDYRERVE